MRFYTKTKNEFLLEQQSKSLMKIRRGKRKKIMICLIFYLNIIMDYRLKIEVLFGSTCKQNRSKLFRG